MKTSESIKELAAALAKAQSMYSHAKKENKNEYFKSNYADLASCIDAAKKPLADNGLSVAQVIDCADGEGMWLETILLHSSGEWISGKYPIKPSKPDPQSIGSALSYSRRYAFCAITGIAADDDDGNSASQVSAPAVNGLKTFKQATDVKQAQPVITIDYFAMIEDSKSLDELAKVWKSIPKHLQPSYVNVKNAQKAFINGPDDVSHYPSTENKE